MVPLVVVSILPACSPDPLHPLIVTTIPEIANINLNNLKILPSWLKAN
jgi:hypothetical protein